MLQVSPLSLVMSVMGRWGAVAVPALDGAVEAVREVHGLHRSGPELLDPGSSYIAVAMMFPTRVPLLETAQPWSASVKQTSVSGKPTPSA